MSLGYVSVCWEALWVDLGCGSASAKESPQRSIARRRRLPRRPGSVAAGRRRAAAGDPEGLVEDRSSRRGATPPRMGPVWALVEPRAAIWAQYGAAAPAPPLHRACNGRARAQRLPERRRPWHASGTPGGSRRVPLQAPTATPRLPGTERRPPPRRGKGSSRHQAPKARRTSRGVDGRGHCSERGGACRERRRGATGRSDSPFEDREVIGLPKCLAHGAVCPKRCRAPPPPPPDWSRSRGPARVSGAGTAPWTPSGAWPRRRCAPQAPSVRLDAALFGVRLFGTTPVPTTNRMLHPLRRYFR